MKSFIDNYCFKKNYLRIILKIVFGELPYQVILNELDIDAPKNYYSIADFGSGTGYYTLKFLSEKFCRIAYALDINGDYLDELVISAQNNDTSHKLEIIETDLIERTKLKNESIDIALCCFLFSEIADKNKKDVLQNILQSVAVNGKCFITDFINCKTIRKFGITYPLEITEFKKNLAIIKNIVILREIVSKYTYSFVIQKNA
ncbi:MAG TPA: class I SAM-dependent methyltransferase [bacterium]|nr:class I SAM-dependent methyltransferase [bacterium]HPP88286.1 class I SAM-dependent methyltransferase [bacterium]